MADAVTPCDASIRPRRKVLRGPASEGGRGSLKAQKPTRGDAAGVVDDPEAGYLATLIEILNISISRCRPHSWPRPTVAAVNGHAFAGGLITAAVRDHRIAVPDQASFGLNEVPIGIPMPAVYVRMLAYAWGEPVAARTALLGEIFTPAQAHALGLVRELVPAELRHCATSPTSPTPSTLSWPAG